MKICIYCRVSTSEQAKEGYSQDNQLERLKSYCKAKNYEIQHIYSDGGYSGRNVKRPGYKAMFDHMDSWDGVLVYKIDRIHRNRLNFITMMETLKKHEKEFISMTESLDTSTAMGRFVMAIITDIAQLESEQIGERVYEGMSHKAKTCGGILGLNIPYGYDYKDKQLIINLIEAKTVRDIYSLYLKGNSLEKIALRLNDREVPTKHNGKWTATTIGRILRNPIYCGYLRWEEYINKNDHRAIIPIDTYNRIQDKIDINGGKSSAYLQNLW